MTPEELYGPLLKTMRYRMLELGNSVHRCVVLCELCGVTAQVSLVKLYRANRENEGAPRTECNHTLILRDAQGIERADAAEFRTIRIRALRIEKAEAAKRNNLVLIKQRKIRKKVNRLHRVSVHTADCQHLPTLMQGLWSISPVRPEGLPQALKEAREAGALTSTDCPFCGGWKDPS